MHQFGRHIDASPDMLHYLVSLPCTYYKQQGASMVIWPGCNASVYVVSVALSWRDALAYLFLPVITAGMMHSRVHCQ
jgi:hypothetical protein